MEKPNSEISGTPPVGPKGFLSNVRRFFGRVLGKKNQIGINHKPSEEKQSPSRPEAQIPSMPNPAGETAGSTQSEPKPDFNPQTTIRPVKRPKVRTPQPIAVEKSKPKKIESLDHLDEAALIEKMTGEKLSPDELATIKAVSNEKEEITEKPKNKGEILKDYPKIPQETLDLHGKTATEAEREIRLFILRAKRESKRMIRIITGKGLHSEGGQSVLKGVVENKVVELKDEGLVLDRKWEKGGGGALLVYLV